MLLKADSAGEFVTYKVTIPSSGTYDVKVGIRKGNQNGIVQLAIDGVNQGSSLWTITRRKWIMRSWTLGRLHSRKQANRHFNSWSQGRIQTARVISFVLDYIDLVR